MNEPNKLLVTFINNGPERPGSPYNVWQTDYSTYVLVYSCTQILTNVLKSETAWVLSRTRTLPNNKVDQLKATLEQNGIDTSDFEIIDQLNCQ